MIIKMFNVYDSKVEAYHRPFFANSTGEAKRMIIEAAKDESSMLFQYPADFTLFEIGDFDDNDGQIELYESAVNLGNVIMLASEGRTTKNLAEELANS